MIEFLKTVFGNNIAATVYNYPAKTPYYIRDGYTAHYISWNNNACVLLSPTSSEWRLPTLKKQLKNFQEICDIPCALCLANLTSLQRRNLLENNIPFVSLSQQVYLPFWGCSFIERFRTETPAKDIMSPSTQLVFLYLYYSVNMGSINLTQLAKKLELSKATCTRAIQDLTASGLLKLKAEGTNKWIVPAFEKPEFLKKGYTRMRSPVERLLYLKNKPIGTSYPLSGIQALSAITMVGANDQDGAIAFSKLEGSVISSDNIISRHLFEDFGGYIIEVWIYPPALLAHDGLVDDISLLLSLETNPNERIQMGLDEIRKKHQLPITNED